MKAHVYVTLKRTVLDAQTSLRAVRVRIVLLALGQRLIVVIHGAGGRRVLRGGRKRLIAGNLVLRLREIRLKGRYRR